METGMRTLIPENAFFKLTYNHVSTAKVPGMLEVQRSIRSSRYIARNTSKVYYAQSTTFYSITSYFCSIVFLI